ncbi:plant UBX domain-containing protein 2 isoform X1 [Aristolochia californica]|uniref:plant UBX domain-containing protein 2 isoform X1 n=1 Tax=Aristolochia californica TaxID=171875 RepID=UPI0035D9A780
MDDVKDKVKGFMKKVNKPFGSSSSGKFKGQGRVLGSSSSGTTNPILARPPQNVEARQNQSLRPTNPTAAPPVQNVESKPDSSPPVRPNSRPRSSSPPKASHRPEGFDPFDPFISSTRRTKNGTSLNVFQCPVCGGAYGSEEEVSEHVEACLSDRVAESTGPQNVEVDMRNELMGWVGVYLSGEPSEGSVEVVLKLLRNIVKEPGNDKFRRLRMSNPKINEAFQMTASGVELLEGIGFRLQQQGEEMWATMEAPSDEQICSMREAMSLLENKKQENSPLVDSVTLENRVQQKKVVDRQVRVFFSVPESVAAKIDLPDSFYNLSAEELKREAELKRKKIADSQLLIPKSYKEKQAKAARRKYKATIIRIQFPDGVVLQGVFLPWEPTTVLYEFVSSALKESCLEFELLQPAMPRRRVVPRFPRAGEKTVPTFEDEDLVPSALVTFKPMETDTVLFTGLCNKLLEICEPLTSATGVSLPHS